MNEEQLKFLEEYTSHDEWCTVKLEDAPEDECECVRSTIKALINYIRELHIRIEQASL